MCISWSLLKKIHIAVLAGAGRGPESVCLSSTSVEPLVPLLPFLEDHGAHHGTHHDAQQGTQQQQEHLPSRQRSAAEVTRRVVNVVWGGRGGATW